MAITTLTGEPSSFHIGDTVRWTKAWTDYPADDGWSLTYGFSGRSQFKVHGTASGDGFIVTMPTEGYLPGNYTYSAVVSKTGVGTASVAGPASMRALPNLLLQNNELMVARANLAEAEAEHKALLKKKYKSFSVGSLSATIYTADEQYQRVLYLRREVARLEALEAYLLGRGGGMIRTRFIT